MKVAVYAATGRIPKGRTVRFTGHSKSGAYEVDVPGIGRRSHALVTDCPSGHISPTEPGYALAFGPLVEAEAAASLATDDDVTPQADGTLDRSSSGDRRCVGTAITPAMPGTSFLMLLRWSGRP